MRDEAAIPHLTCTKQKDGTVCYFFGDTTIRAIEMQTAGSICLIPVSGDQVACGEWAELDEGEVREYCDLLERKMEKCKIWANQNTAWCRGCEHKFPGLEQFDFYQEQKESGGSDGKR